MIHTHIIHPAVHPWHPLVYRTHHPVVPTQYSVVPESPFYGLSLFGVLVVLLWMRRNRSR